MKISKFRELKLEKSWNKKYKNLGTKNTKIREQKSGKQNYKNQGTKIEEQKFKKYRKKNQGTKNRRTKI
jgi:hypothetical protein